jgi:cytidylate kinase
MSSRVVVAIDGPAGAGKSTLARRLAASLDLPYVNTGAMYRAVTRAALRSGVDLDDGEGLSRIASRLRFDLSSTGTPRTLLIDRNEPGAELAAPDVERSVSRVAAHPAVRLVLRDEQRRLGRGGAVMEGRDIGTVVFPDAAVKIFLEAPPDERVARRARERGDEEPGEVAGALGTRDSLDERVNPFVPAAEAARIDTGQLDADGVLQEALRVVASRIGGRG